ncbi:hypothetical protein F7734_10505 [Scytonema sp. UIC 10036]|uniref:hypothetical protein n=1 Tax=Scytonema sp. UIC 10036 TaxID=2304196 RepID=UPI0012DAD990|nr:hypothetical protein [Scytonema sp. UIC 10036]MUG92857.1 hypothetical protein [Scytonema sp. UIC 10036]
MKDRKNQGKRISAILNSNFNKGQKSLDTERKQIKVGVKLGLGILTFARLLSFLQAVRKIKMAKMFVS